MLLTPVLLVLACTSDPKLVDGADTGPPTGSDSGAGDGGAGDGAAEAETRIEELGDRTLVLRRHRGRVDLDFGGRSAGALRLNAAWDGVVEPAADGSFTVWAPEQAVLAVQVEDDLGRQLATVLVPSHELLAEDAFVVDAQLVAASLVWPHLPFSAREPLFTTIGLRWLVERDATRDLAHALEAELAAGGTVQDMSAETALLMGLALADAVDAVRAWSMAAGHGDPWPEPSSGLTRPEGDHYDLGRFEIGEGGERDRMRVEVEYRSDTQSALTFTNLATRWAVVAQDGGFQGFVEPTKAQLNDPVAFVFELTLFLAESALDEWRALFDEGFEPDSFGDELGDVLLSQIVSEGSFSFDADIPAGELSWLTVVGPGCYSGCGLSTVDDWGVPGVMTVLTEVALPMIELVAAIPWPDGTTYDIVGDCAASFDDLLTTGLDVARALAESTEDIVLGDYVAAVEHFADAVVLLVQEEALWECLGLHDFFTREGMAEFLSDSVYDMADESVKGLVSLPIDALNTLFSFGGAWLTFTDTNWYGSYVTTALEFECDDMVDGDGDGRVDCDDDGCFGSDPCPIVIDTVEPLEVMIGRSVDIVITGDRFPPGDVHLDAGEGVSFVDASRVSATELRATVVVACVAPPGVATVRYSAAEDPAGADCSRADIACSDGLELVDDPACGLPACGNGLDDDGDGWTDLGDPGCGLDPEGTDEGAAGPDTGCNDGEDNDDDGRIDAADPDCADGYDEEWPDTESDCADDTDEDRDGLTDCEDTDCDGAVSCLTLPTGTIAAEDAPLLVTATESGGQLGTDVVAVGDVDGDGVGDILASVPGSDDRGSWSGLALVFTGGEAGELDADDAVVRIRASSTSDGSFVGSSVCAVGDWNGDGHPDFGVGASGSDSSGAFAGQFGVYYAPLSGSVYTSDADLVVSGDEGRFLVGSRCAADSGGGSLAVAGAGLSSGGTEYPAAVLWVEGGEEGAVGPDDATAVLEASDWRSGFGEGVGVSDLDGDGVADVVVGAPEAQGSALDEGAVFVVLGPRSGTVVDTDADMTLWGGDRYRELGAFVTSVGDLDGDDLPDTIIAEGGYGGELHVVGSAAFTSSDIDDAIAVYTGYQPTGSAGDVDGDGVLDLAITDYGLDPEEGAGVLLGPLVGTCDEDDLHLEITLDARYLSVDARGDLDGDGDADLILGGGGAAGSDGALWVIFGGLD